MMFTASTHIRRDGESQGVLGSSVARLGFLLLALCCACTAQVGSDEEVARVSQAAYGRWDLPVDTDITNDGDRVILRQIALYRTAGSKLFVDSRLEAADAADRRLVEAAVGCDLGFGAETAWGKQFIARTENISNDVNTRVVLRARGVYAVETTGWHTCWLAVRSTTPGGGTDGNRAYTVKSGGLTWLSLQDVSDWATQVEVDDSRLLSPNNAYDVAVLDFTAPANVTRFRATSDLELTNCYNDGGLCRTTPYNQDNSLVQSKLQVMQKAVGGGYCKITSYPTNGYVETNTSWTEHHEPAYHSVVADVSSASSCSRDFRIKVYLKVNAGNEVLLEGGGDNPPWYANTWVK